MFMKLRDVDEDGGRRRKEVDEILLALLLEDNLEGNKVDRGLVSRAVSVRSSEQCLRQLR